eukprot:5625324-Pleurochrysis_carterae.AAC.1
MHASMRSHDARKHALSARACAPSKQPCKDVEFKIPSFVNTRTRTWRQRVGASVWRHVWDSAQVKFRGPVPSHAKKTRKSASRQTGF